MLIDLFTSGTLDSIVLYAKSITNKIQIIHTTDGIAGIAAVKGK